MIRAPKARYPSRPVLVAALEGAGVKIDEAFGVIDLGGAAQALLVRAELETGNAQEVGEALGMDLFPDLEVGHSTEGE